MVIQNLIPIVMFDVLEFDFFQAFFEDDGPTYMLDQIQDIGYESHNALKNMGSVSIFTFLYFIRIVFFCLIWILA